MRVLRLGSVVLLAGMVWLGAGARLSGIPSLPGARAQGTLTPPAGQPRVTAPGGLRGRGLRRHRISRVHRRHRAR